MITIKILCELEVRNGQVVIVPRPDITKPGDRDAIYGLDKETSKELIPYILDRFREDVESSIERDTKTK